MLENGLLELVVSSCRELPINKDEIPVCKPIVFLLGRVKEACTATESAYYLTLEMKPYLTADMCGPVNVILTHALDGRLKNTFTAAKTSSIIQCTAELFVIKSKLYCDVIEMQFVNLKTESSNSVPWSVTNKDNKNKKRNSVESRIVAVHKSMQKKPPTSTVKTETPQKPVKVDNIAREIIKRKRGNSTIVVDEDIGETIVIDNELEAKKGDRSLENNSVVMERSRGQKGDDQEIRKRY